MREGKYKQPVLIRRTDGRPFAFAGLWDRWFERPGEPVYTCTIVTTAASNLLRPVQDRMPVILEPHERDLVALKYSGGLSNAEIARVIGASESNAGTRLHRVIEKLRKACDVD